MWYQNIGSMFFHLVTKARVWPTDRQNYNPQDRASIAALHGKNQSLVSMALNKLYITL